MLTRIFIGKAVSLPMLNKDETVSFCDEGEYDEDYDSKGYTIAEIFLSDFDCGGFTDKYGRNAYSIRLILDGDKINKILRVGHIHMCGGQGSDDELPRFPHKSLEKEAEHIINKFLA